jgi:hypothetical protein
MACKCKVIRGLAGVWTAGILGIGLTLASGAHAALIVGDIPAAPSTPDGETKISNGFQYSPNLRGIEFTTGPKPIHIDSIDYVLIDDGDGPAPEIRIDAGGHPGAAVTLPSQPTRTNNTWGTYARYHFTYASTPFSADLQPDTSYWLIGRAAASQYSRWRWEGLNTASFDGSATVGSTLDSTNAGVTWGTPSDSLQSLFEIQGTSVPEPAFLGLLGTAGLLTLRRRRVVC